MKSRKFISGVSLVILMLLALPAMSSSAITDPAPVTEHVKIDNPRAEELVHRLEEIKAMDKSTLTRSERKALRKEVKDIKKEMKENGGGVYLSVGAIIIIILLLILLV